MLLSGPLAFHHRRMTLTHRALLPLLLAIPARQGAPRLTNRDHQILRFLIESLSNKEIAAQLQISESAVKASLQQLFGTTNVRTRSALVRVVLDQYRDEI